MHHDDREQHQVILSNNKIGNHNIFVALVPIITAWGVFALTVFTLGLALFAISDFQGFLHFLPWVFKGAIYAIGAAIAITLVGLAFKYVLGGLITHVIGGWVREVIVPLRQSRVPFANDNLAVYDPSTGLVVSHHEDTRYNYNIKQVEGEQAQPLQIASPAIQVPTFAQLLTTRQITPYEDASILGYTNGRPRTGQWEELHSFMALGISGSGKSSTVAYYVALAVLHGARLLVIDPDAEENDSLVQRLQALSFAFLCPPGVDAKSASRVLNIAEQELESPGAYPVVWCVDEFSTIMRMGEKGLGAWGDIAGQLALTVEDWAQRGRKRKRTVIAIGQIGKASRTGGTELRASMTATFVHRLSTQQARLVLDGPDAKLCPTLDTGEVVVLLANSVETYRMHIPYTTPEDMESVARLMTPVSSVFPGRGMPTPKPIEIVPKQTRNELETGLETGWQAKVALVRDLRSAGRNQKQIIQHVWGISPGGSVEYRDARQEYQQIIAQLNAEEA